MSVLASMGENVVECGCEQELVAASKAAFDLQSSEQHETKPELTSPITHQALTVWQAGRREAKAPPPPRRSAG